MNKLTQIIEFPLTFFGLWAFAIDIAEMHAISSKRLEWLI
jgi:hypothetical protein